MAGDDTVSVSSVIFLTPLLNPLSDVRLIISSHHILE